MKQPFLIIGTPRSRTAWLAGFLSYGPVTCLHEPSALWTSLEDLWCLLNTPNVGAADSFLTLHWRQALEWCPQVKLVVVRRPIPQVLASLDGLGLHHPATEGLLRAIDWAAMQAGKQPGTLTVTFDELQHENICRALFEYTLERDWDREHWMKFRNRNIQADIQATLAAAQSNVEGLQAVYGEHLASLGSEV